MNTNKKKEPTLNAPNLSCHVRQVAELVKRLDRDELRELLRLVPKLQTEAAALSQPDELVAWAREQLAQHAAVARPMQEDDLFLADKTVANYFALPEAERERIWIVMFTKMLQTSAVRSGVRG
jgi:hypothetical protein